MGEGYLSTRIIKWINSQPGCRAIKMHSGPHQGRGEPDIFASIRGRMMVVETKLPGKGGTITQIQRYMLQQWRSAGAMASSATTLEEVQSIVHQLILEDDTYGSQ